MCRESRCAPYPQSKCSSAQRKIKCSTKQQTAILVSKQQRARLRKQQRARLVGKQATPRLVNPHTALSLARPSSYHQVGVGMKESEPVGLVGAGNLIQRLPALHLVKAFRHLQAHTQYLALRQCARLHRPLPGLGLAIQMRLQADNRRN